MALIEPITLETKGPTTLEATYSGIAFFYINGFFVTGPIASPAVLPFAFDEPITIDAHDVRSGSINLKPFTHPTIFWRPSVGAVRYRIFHTPPGGVESIIHEMANQLETIRFEYRSQPEWIEGWHFFRVEAVNAGGIESTVNAEPHFVYDLPPLVSDIAIAGGSGVFNFTITP